LLREATVLLQEQTMIMGSSRRTQQVPSFLARRPLLRTIRAFGSLSRPENRRDAPPAERPKQDEARSGG
jgi:hypothetical protein